MNFARLSSAASVRRWLLVALAAAALSVWTATVAAAQTPIKIGFSVSLTGGLASSGKAHLLSKQIWVEEINAKGGLLGRPVKLVYYDDQTNACDGSEHLRQAHGRRQGRHPHGPCDQPDRRGHAADHAAQEDGHGAPGAGLQCRVQVFAAISRARHSAPIPKACCRTAFFEVAKTSKPAPKTVALVGADAEFSNNVLVGARENARNTSCRSSMTGAIRRRRSISLRSCAPSRRPTPTSSCSRPIRRTPSAWCARPPRSGSRRKCSAARMVGMQYASLITQLVDKLNRVVNYHFYVPSAENEFPGIEEFLEKYQSRAKERRRRSARLLSAALCLCRHAGAGAGDQGHRRPRRRQARRAHPQERVQHHRRRHQVQRARRMGDPTPDDGAVPEHPGQRARAVSSPATGRSSSHPAQYKDGELEQPFAK